MIKRICLFAAVLMVFAACTNFSQEVDASILEVSPSTLSFDSVSGSFNLTVQSGTEWDVSVPGWIHVSSISPVTGSPFEWSVSCTYDENTRSEARSESISFKTKLKQVKVSASQKGKPVVHVTSVSVKPTSVSLGVGNAVTLTAEVLPSDAANKNVSWQSSNSSVATVSSNSNNPSAATVKGLKAGNATITVTTEDGNKMATCSVTVGVSVTGIEVSPSSRTMTEGESYTLNVNVYPYNATNRNVSWSSNNTSVATVSSTGTVKAVKEGSATITAKSEDGGYTSTCKITVTKATVAVTGVTVSPASLNLTVGESSSLSVTVSPSNATNKNVTWSSSKTSVATVDASGKVTAVSAGSATISVKTEDGGYTATCSVTVKAATVAVTGVTVSPASLNLTVGQSSNLSVTVSPSNATSKNVTWSSNKTSVATVDSSGKVTAVSAGSATITVKTEDGGYTATCQVTVKAATVAVTGVTLDKKTMSLNVGENGSLKATITPSNATEKGVTWTASNSAVKAEGNGLECKVTAQSVGSANVTVTTKDGSYSATCQITVTKAGPSYVDLGLSVKWATFNLGASIPEGYGDYYAWGETNTKTNYSSSTYSVSTSYYSLTNRTVLDLNDDAAAVKWGDKWRMPTLEEMSELMDDSKCSRNWGTRNGIYGCTFTSKQYPSNSIFLPAAGYRSGSSSPSNVGTEGNYWTSSLSTEGASQASMLTIMQSPYLGKQPRYFGYSIRPVYGDPFVHVVSIALKSSIQLKVGETETLTPTISPSDATNKSVTWKSSNSSVATVDNNGKVTAKAVGSAIITVTTDDGGKTAQCSVAVASNNGGINSGDPEGFDEGNGEW